MKVSFETSSKANKAPKVLREGDLVVYRGDQNETTSLICSAPLGDKTVYFVMPLSGVRQHKVIHYNSLEELTASLCEDLTFYRHEDVVLDLTNVPEHTLGGTE